MDADLIIEGGGVKGIALAGAICELEKNGYRPKNVAGTSAGAIIASLLSAGYTAAEIEKELKKLDYKKILGEDLIDKFGMLGKGASLFRSFGIYNCDYLENFIGALLARKGKMVFGDLPKWMPNGQDCERCKRLYNLCVTATDLTTGRLLVLPDDLTQFGIDPAKFSIARAVRISMSFPLFFEPVRLKDMNGKTHYLVDGGMLSNYPAFILDNGRGTVDRATIGVRLLDSTNEHNHSADKENFIEYLKSMVETLVEFHDEFYRERAFGDTERTIFVPSAVGNKPIKTMDFQIKSDEIETLFNNGVAATQKFLSVFNFDEWREKFRSPAPVMPV
ncbi:MAG: patatin-like phospholipase family protein [Christensenellaceae bacterium]|jgi:NTE family protein|nr:patatin-like phospholipase family protein [Christensenellaceae bacterium]